MLKDGLYDDRATFTRLRIKNGRPIAGVSELELRDVRKKYEANIFQRDIINARYTEEWRKPFGFYADTETT